MRKLSIATILLCLPFLLFGQEVIEKIEIEGNIRVTEETILYYLSSREGDYYNPELLKRDLRVLWSTGFFSDIKMKEEEGVKGKIVKIMVEENPVIKDIVYKTGKKLKEDDIVNKLKEKDQYILPYSYYSQYKVQKIKQTIENLLVEKGLTQGTVKVETDKTGNNEVKVVFNINEGPKIKVGEVEFVGEPKVLESTLHWAMKQNKEHNLISWVMGKDVFKKNKLREDLAAVREELREHGYMEANVGEPQIKDITKRSIFFTKKEMKKIVIPVDAGYLYFVGDINIEGNKVISAKHLRNLIPMKKGEVYSTKQREKAIEEIGKLYRNLGYLYAQIIPVENLDPKRKRVNLTLRIHEGEVAYLHRLKIRGNTYTKDKVIRREIMLREGDRFSFSLFKNSLRRMNQLGLVELVGEPKIQPNPDDPSQIDVTLNVKELQRNNIQFTAGYSGYQGPFVSLSYSTVNFLGAGEKVEVMAQHGKRIKNYMFGFTEPYFLDNPISLGFNIYSRDMIYPFLYRRKGQGIDFNFGARIKGYWRTNIVYSYEKVNIQLPEEQMGGYPTYDPIYFQMFGLGKYNISSITPTLYRSTVDSPLTPTRGTKYLVSCMFAGSFLGGEISIIKPRVEWTMYQPSIHDHVLGLHAEYQFINPIGDSRVPFWERFYLGGERSIRGYRIYSIGPRSERGTNIGGEKSLVLNAEYNIPLGGPVYAIFFWDVGNAYGRDDKVSLKNIYSSAGLEMRVFVPALRVPFRLIFAYNSPTIYKDDSNFAFRFAIGTTF